MPREIHFYECDWCGAQSDTYLEAEACEWVHQYEEEKPA